MALWKCNACGGTYNDLSADGTVYHHACGPLPPDAHGVQAERANKRDENVPHVPGHFPADIKSRGAGVTPMSGQVEPEPLWILALRGSVP